MTEFSGASYPLLCCRPWMPTKTSLSECHRIMPKGKKQPCCISVHTPSPEFCFSFFQGNNLVMEFVWWLLGTALWNVEMIDFGELVDICCLKTSVFLATLLSQSFFLGAELLELGRALTYPRLLLPTSISSPGVRLPGAALQVWKLSSHHTVIAPGWCSLLCKQESKNDGVLWNPLVLGLSK